MSKKTSLEFALEFEHRQSNMDIQQILTDRHIVHIDPEIMGGVSVLIGTRVPLQTLFDYLEGEEGLNEFLEDFPHLKTSALQVLETIARVMLNIAILNDFQDFLTAKAQRAQRVD
jgi:uncharacterized protein (DUF433 family)